MNTETYDLIVVGAGPAGSSTSAEAAHHEVKTLMIEEHPSVGDPAHCGGVFSKQSMKHLEVEIPSGLVLNRVQGLTIRADRNRMDIPRTKLDLLILDRSAFDKWLAERAEDAGVEVWTSSKAVSLQVGRKECTMKIRRDSSLTEVRSKIVVGADGSRGQIRKMAGIRVEQDLAMGMQYTVRSSDIDPSRIVMVFDQDFAPGGFAWIIPIAEEKARVGVGVRGAHGPVKILLEEFLQHEFSKWKLIRASAHRIPAQGAITPLYSNRFMTVGDAAGQVNPLTGAGIATCMASGRIAGKTAAEGIALNDQTTSTLKGYEEEWMKTMGHHFGIAMKLRRMLETIPREEAFRFTDDRIRHSLLAEGESTNLGALARFVLRHPKMIPYLWQLVRLRSAILI